MTAPEQQRLMVKTTIFILTFLLSTFFSFGQTITEVIVPTFNDKFTEFVKKLESGETDINTKILEKVLLIESNSKLFLKNRLSLIA